MPNNSHVLSSSPPSQMGCRSSENNIEKPKRKHRKGLWSPEEDQRLRNYLLRHGHGCWSSVPVNAGLQRNGKSCRLRWINYLRPGLKRGTFSAEEEETILTLHRSLGNKWSQIARQLPGRTDNEVKNHWHSHLKKRVAETEETHQQTQTHPEDRTYSSLSSCEISAAGDRNPGDDLLGHHSSLPKILFTEWLSLDNDTQSGTIISDQPEMIGTKNGFDYHSNMNDCLFDHLLLGEETFFGDYNYNSSEQSEGSASASEMIYPSQFDICSNFASTNGETLGWSSSATWHCHVVYPPNDALTCVSVAVPHGQPHQQC